MERNRKGIDMYINPHNLNTILSERSLNDEDLSRIIDRVNPDI